MPQPFTFAGKSSFVETSTTPEGLEAVVSLISKVKQLYFNSFKGIPYIVNHPRSTHYPKFCVDETDEPSLSIDVMFDTSQRGLSDDVRNAFESLYGELMTLQRNPPQLDNLVFTIMGGLTGSLPQIRTSILISPGYYVCPKCDSYVEDAPDNHIYWDEEVVAICARTSLHGDVYFSDSALGQKISDWQVSKYDLGDNLTISIMDNNSMLHRKVARELLMHAKLEESSFRSISYEPKDNATVYILAKDGMPIGYAYWNNFNDYDERVLRQMFIMPEHRGGTGKKLMKATVDLEAPGDKKFSVESPNATSIQMLISLGYAKREGDGIQGIKCTFVNGA
ncbi:GNAT family N-acetyltransferase [Candidatus Woesearchaeota archaeon]|nr:GNAT family N-acetyltransferase [Candidatus Woesearchaeota archaeon]